MKKIRVAFCLRDMQLGGVESVLVRTLDKLLNYKNIEVSIITYVNIKTPVYCEYFKKHPQIKLYSLYPCSWLGTKLPHFFVWRLLISGARKIYRDFKRLFVLNKFKNFDAFIDYHDFGFHDELRYVKGAKKIAWFHSSVDVFEKRNFINYLKYYDKLVVLTDEFIKDFNALYGENKKLVRIYNPIDVEKIQNMANKDENSIDGDYFCSVTRLTPDKDIKTMLCGFDIFWNNADKPDLKLVLVGDGNKKKEYEKYAKTLKSSKHILFIGAKKNPFVYMKNAKANILSSFGEGLPTVLIESVAVGTLNIASNCKCGPSEILLNGRGGLLFNPGDSYGLAKCMLDVYKKKIDANKMINESTKALNRFDGDKIMKQIISLIS